MTTITIELIVKSNKGLDHGQIERFTLGDRNPMVAVALACQQAHEMGFEVLTFSRVVTGKDLAPYKCGQQVAFHRGAWRTEAEITELERLRRVWRTEDQITELERLHREAFPELYTGVQS